MLPPIEDRVQRAREAELERAVAGLRDSEERYRSLVERLPVVAYSEDLENAGPTTDYVAPSIERLLGYTAAEWVSDADLWRERLHSDDRDRVLSERGRLTTHERSSFAMEYRMLRKDGRTIWVLDDAVVVEYRGRSRVEGMLQDVTARKESEDAWARQAKELTEANSRLLELDELKTNFVITASHELRTPLTAVIGFMATLGERWNQLEESERREFVQTVERQGRRILRLVEDLHALSRIDQGELQTSTMAVELAPVLGRAVAVFRSTGAEVDLDVAAGLRADGDPARVQQILGNLIANAIKYGAPPIRVDARPDGTTIVIRVRDEGPGVPQDLHSRLFERFARSAQQEDRVQPGFGLGLATARELARTMRGDLWYQHESSGSTTFCLRLPKAPSLSTHGPVAPLRGIREGPVPA